MKLTISKQGVDIELEGDDILKALFSENNTALYKLKLALDKLEAEELSEPSDEDVKNLPSFSAHEVLEMLSPKNYDVFGNEISSTIKEKPSSDTEVQLPQNKPFIVKKKAKKRKSSRKRKPVNKKVPQAKKHSVSQKKKKVAKFVGKPKPIKNDEDDPIIRPAIRPKTNNVEVNVL
jgi:hypothetical protein